MRLRGRLCRKRCDLMETDPVLIVLTPALVLACCLLVWQRWRRRFGAMSSPLMKPPAYRALLVLVLVGVLLVSIAPEAGLVRIPTRVAVLRSNPALALYAAPWPLIWIRTLMGKM